MCGIAIIVNGVRIERSSFICNSQSQPGDSVQSLGFSIDDLESALRRRGPDSLGTRKLFLNEVSSFIEEGLEFVHNENGCFTSENGRTLCVQSFPAEFRFIGAVLQLRGTSSIVQPLVDKSKNIMVFNGEIYGGISIGKDENDTETLMRALENCSVEDSIVNVLSRVRGPWAVIYWQDSSRTLWFGRDAFGRRSLLVHWPTTEDPRFLLSSVSPASHFEQSFDSDAENSNTCPGFWEELPCGIYSITVEALKNDGFLASEVRKHEWTDSLVDKLIKWERISVEPNPEEIQISRCKSLSVQHRFQSANSDVAVSESGSLSGPAETVLISLRESVRRRSSLYTIFQGDTDAEKELNPVAILFSGGLDSMILAALLNECLDSRYGIDLLNVSFDGESAPDRVSAKAGIQELTRITPSRKWKLVEIDSSLSTLTYETKHVTSLISPANTYMDINIGIALWLASGGDGWVSEEHEDSSAGNHVRVRYKSKSRILLVGSGADEQCAGYGRHRTKFRNTSWLGLHEEMKLDIQRIWKRNLGRDDRCIADNGKEARFPFLDEDVIKVLLDFPLWEVADLNQPSGVGDKKILREVAQLLGVCEAASLPKRAIQFGSRIARESNRKNFGSNRAANQASAGSVVFR